MIFRDLRYAGVGTKSEIKNFAQQNALIIFESDEIQDSVLALFILQIVEDIVLNLQFSNRDWDQQYVYKVLFNEYEFF